MASLLRAVIGVQSGQGARLALSSGDDGSFIPFGLGIHSIQRVPPQRPHFASPADEGWERRSGISFANIDAYMRNSFATSDGVMPASRQLARLLSSAGVINVIAPLGVLASGTNGGAVAEGVVMVFSSCACVSIGPPACFA